jgi:RNA polymerase sigma-70 factor, ECF subfamily
LYDKSWRLRPSGIEVLEALVRANTAPNHGELLAQVFAAEFAFVYSALLRFGVGTRDAEDVAQEVFMQVHRKLNEYDSARPIRAWLYGFAFRAASEYRRSARQRREVLGQGESDCAAVVASADDLLIAQQEQQLATQALEQVDFERRAVLVAYELHEIPMKDIAEALEIPLHTAYSRLRVGREEFAVAVRRLRLRRGEA